MKDEVAEEEPFLTEEELNILFGPDDPGPNQPPPDQEQPHEGP